MTIINMGDRSRKPVQFDADLRQRLHIAESQLREANENLATAYAVADMVREQGAKNIARVIANPSDYHMAIGSRWVSLMRAMESYPEDAAAFVLAVAHLPKLPDPTCGDSDCRKTLDRCNYCEEHMTHGCRSLRHTREDGE